MNYFRLQSSDVPKYCGPLATVNHSSKSDLEAVLLKLETQGGYFIFVLMDWYSGSWSLIFLAVLEVILVAWVSCTLREKY